MYLGAVKNRILLVDDHAVVRMGIRALLRPHFTICGEGCTGDEAIAKTIELKPDLVILDVTMPIMNGLEAARRIRALAPATKILLLSILDSSESEPEAKAAGADAFLPKTCSSTQLISVVEELLGWPP
jgi:DNA-binding NarL/FixJ family response regulator